MINHRTFVIVFVRALLHACFQNGSSRPLPGEERCFMENRPAYSREVPESPQNTHDMPLDIDPVSAWHDYAEFLMSSPLHEHQSTSSSHGLDQEHITNPYHHPSSSNTILDHHSNLPLDHFSNVPLDHYSNLPSHEEMWDQNWNPLSEYVPNGKQQTIHQQKMDDVSGNHFLVSAQLEDFGWLSTLFFPGSTSLQLLIADDWGLSRFLHHNVHLDAIPAPEEHVRRAWINFQVILHYIDMRNKQFLMLFTPATEETSNYLETLRKRQSYQDMTNEHESLLQWVSLQFGSIPQPKGQPGTSETGALSPFQELLFEFVNTDWRDPQLLEARWRPQLRASRMKPGSGSILLTPASIATTYLAKITIYALGSYYKSSNRIKWGKLFETDDAFVNNWRRVKNNEQHGFANNDQRERLEKLKILPWKDQDQFDWDPAVKKILAKFRNSCSKELRVEGKFSQISSSQNDNY